MVITTRKQRETIKRYYDRATHDSIQFVMSYKQFRRQAEATFGCDGAIALPWFGMWLCIERDGYAHS